MDEFRVLKKRIIRKTKKLHKCWYCDDIILKNTQCVYNVNILDYEFVTYYTCFTCSGLEYEYTKKIKEQFKDDLEDILK